MRRSLTVAPTPSIFRPIDTLVLLEFRDERLMVNHRDEIFLLPRRLELVSRESCAFNLFDRPRPTLLLSSGSVLQEKERRVDTHLTRSDSRHDEMLPECRHRYIVRGYCQRRLS